MTYFGSEELMNTPMSEVRHALIDELRNIEKLRKKLAKLKNKVRYAWENHRDIIFYKNNHGTLREKIAVNAYNKAKREYNEFLNGITNPTIKNQLRLNPGFLDSDYESLLRY